MKDFHNNDTDKLIETVSKLKNKEDCYEFFEDLCTIKEILEMSKRLKAAYLLKQGYSYQEIIKEISISTATLSRISKCINYGSGGYEKALKNIKY